MSNLLTRITDKAVNAYRIKLDNLAGSQPNIFMHNDPILQQAITVSNFQFPGMNPDPEFSRAFFQDPDFAMLAPHPESPGVMILTVNGGSRIDTNMIINGIFSSAFMQMYFFSLPITETTFLRLVFQNIDELRKALQTGKIKSYAIHGIGKMTIPTDSKLSTPWGTIYSAPTTPQTNHFPIFGQAKTKCIFIQERNVSVVFDQSPNPNPVFSPDEANQQRGLFLLPFACALASENIKEPTVPLATWSTNLLPVQFGFGFSQQLLPPAFGNEPDFSTRASDLEEWSRLVDKVHTPEIDIAIKRLVSSVAHRVDRTDALIDAVTAWENLLGTHNEVTFRVSASIAKMIEPDPLKRKEIRKRLSKIYEIRSRIVHGAMVESQEINDASADAIGFAILALRESFKRGKEWLSLKSNERSDAVLLEWP